MATENQNHTTLANHFEKFRESMKELQSSIDEKLKQVMKKFDDLRASIPKHDRKVLICGYTEEEDCVCEVTNSLNSVYQDINDEDDVDLDFKEEESHQTQLQIQQNVGSIVLEIGGHEDFLAEIKDPSSLVNQVCAESIHDKVISVSYSDFSSPSLSTNTAVGTICANKKGILVADNMFDKSSERNGYSVELQPKPPDAYNSLNNLIMYGFNTTTELKTKESIYQYLVSVAANNQQPSQVVYKDDANWFSPYTVHRLERRVVPHYFFGKLMNHTYMECWNCIAAKYMEIPDKRLAVFHCDGLAVGINIDDMTRIFYFLDYWGIINSYVAAQSLELREDGLCFSKDSDGELRVSMTLLKSIDNLIQFDRLKCLLSAANVYPELGCRGHEVFNLDNRVQDRLSENPCDYCSRPLFIMYYQSQKKVDVLLSLDCFHEGRFVTGHLSLDFTRVDSGKDYEISKYTVEAPESVALIFPIDVVVPPGNTGLDPSQINFFQVLNISTKINKGIVEIITKVDLIKKGDKVGPFEAALLVRLGLRSISYGVIVQSAYDTDSLVSPEVLDLTVNDSVAKLANGVSNSASLTQAEQVKKYLKYPVKFDVAVYIIVLRCFGNPSKPHHSLLDDWQSKTEYLPKNLKFEDILHAIEGWSDKYVIGRGKHGTVYRTESVKSTKSWVVKRVDFFETLKMRTVNLLGHRNMVKLAGYYIKDRYSFMVTEYKRKYALDQKELEGHIKWASISSNSLMLVISLLKLCAYMVKEKSQFKDEFVTMGGVSLFKSFVRTMESISTNNVIGINLSQRLAAIGGNFHSTHTLKFHFGGNGTELIKTRLMVGVMEKNNLLGTMVTLCGSAENELNISHRMNSAYNLTDAQSRSFCAQSLANVQSAAAENQGVSSIAGICYFHIFSLLFAINPPLRARVFLRSRECKE